MHTTCGYTLLELLITVALVAIIAAIAVPSYQRTITQEQQTAALNRFVGALFFARSEAIKTGEQVLLCPSEDGATCDSSNDWGAGWIAFVDDNMDRSLTSGESILQVGDALDSNFSLKGGTGITDYIRFIGDGAALDSGTFTFCDNRGASHARSIVINSLGRAKVSRVDASGIALSCAS